MIGITSYLVFFLCVVLALSILTLGLNLQWGSTGQISLGHGAFYAIGGYTHAILTAAPQPQYLGNFGLAAAVCFVAGILMGFPALMLVGHYLALATFALACAMPQLLKFKHFESFTGGVQGIILMKPTPPIEFSLFGQPLLEDRWLYFMVLAVTVIMFVIARNLLDGRIGRAIVAVRDQPIAAGALGVNLAVTKTITFGVSAAFTGVAGALGAITVAFVAPDSFNVFLSISFLVGVVVGGLASIPGAIFGAAFIQFVPNIADQISKSAPWAVYGVFLIALMYLAPNGIMGIINRRRRST